MSEKNTMNRLKEAIESKNIVIGSDRTVKYLKMKKLKLVIVSSNCPEDLKKDITKYANLSGTEIEIFDGTSKQLGIFCGKPFPIAALSIK